VQSLVGTAWDELEVCQVKAVKPSAYLNKSKNLNGISFRSDIKLLFPGNWFHSFQL